MSLIAWYPLNGNINDYSGNANNSSIVGTHIVQVDDGKIGKCYERQVVNNSTGHILSNNKIDLPGDFTIACWAYVSECHANTANGLVTHHDHATNTGAGITVRYISDSDFRISCNTGDGSSRTYHTYYGTSNIKDRWAHLIVRFQKNIKELSLWVDGNKEYTLTYNMVCKNDNIAIFGWSTGYLASANYRPASKINDVRIYNHALSVKEIKELAKAKVLHYSFNDYDESTVNLGVGTWASYTSYYTYNYDNVNHTHICTRHTGSTSTTLALNNSIATANLKNGDVYTISGFLYKNGSPFKSIAPHISTYHTTTISKETRSDGYFSYTQTFASGQWIIHSNLANAVIGDILTLKYLQVEKKPYATAYTPDIRETKIIYDSSGYNNHASILPTTAPTWTKGKIGENACEFNKQGVITAPSLDLSTYTYTFWVKLITPYAGSWRKFIGRNPSGSDRSPGIWFYHTANKIHLQQRLSDGSNGGGVDFDLNLEEWQHIAFICEGGSSSTKLKSYYNGGTERVSTYALAPMIGEAPLIINCDGNTHYLIDDFRIYATALSARDIKEIYQTRASIDEKGNLYTNHIKENARAININKEGVLTSSNFSEVGVVEGLAAWYPLNKTPKDISGNENHGAVYGATAIEDKGNFYYDFNGASYIDCGSPQELVLNTGGSISAWVKLRSFNGSSWSSVIVGKGGSSWVNHHYILFKASATNKLLFSVSDGSTYLNGGGPYSPDLVLDRWYHVVATWNNTVKNMYIDGELVDSVTSPIMPINSMAPVSIGRTGTNGYYLDGFLNDIRIYNRALSIEEVNILYNLGTEKNQIKITDKDIYVTGEIKEI